LKTTRSSSRGSHLPSRQGRGNPVFILSLRSPRSELGQRENGAKRDTRFTGAASAASSSDETFYLPYTSEKGCRPVNIGPRRSYFRSRVASLKGVGMKEPGEEDGGRRRCHCCTAAFTISELIYTWDVSFRGCGRARKSVYSRIKREQMQRGGAATARKTFTRRSLCLFRSSCASRLSFAIGILLVAALRRCSIIKAILPLSSKIRGIQDRGSTRACRNGVFPPRSDIECSTMRTLRILHGRAIDSTDPALIVSLTSYFLRNSMATSHVARCTACQLASRSINDASYSHSAAKRRVCTRE